MSKVGNSVFYEVRIIETETDTQSKSGTNNQKFLAEHINSLYIAYIHSPTDLLL
jgi:hypothetical protein